MAWCLLFYIDPIKRVPSERALFEINHFGTHWGELHGMRDGEPGRLLFKDGLRFFVKLGALGLIGDRDGLLNQIFKGLVTPFGHVATTRLGSIAA